VRASLRSLRSEVSSPSEQGADCPEPPRLGGIAQADSRSISAVNQWRLEDQIRHFLAELSACIADTSSPLISPSGKAPDVVRNPENSKHSTISPAAKL
jgi:hypothetical protein